MKKLLCIVFIVLLSGCAAQQVQTIIKPEIVTVDRPVFVSPPPPDVKEVELYTLKLTDADLKDPGKVAQYYKIDVIQLLGQIDIYKIILERYRQANVDTLKLQGEVDQIYLNNKTRIETQVQDAQIPTAPAPKTRTP